MIYLRRSRYRANRKVVSDNRYHVLHIFIFTASLSSCTDKRAKRAKQYPLIVDAKFGVNFLTAGFNYVQQYEHAWIVKELRDLLEGHIFEDEEHGELRTFCVEKVLLEPDGRFIVHHVDTEYRHKHKELLTDVVKCLPEEDMRDRIQTLMEIKNEGPFAALGVDFLPLKNRVPLTLQTNGEFMNVLYSKARYCALAAFLL